MAIEVIDWIKQRSPFLWKARQSMPFGISDIKAGDFIRLRQDGQRHIEVVTVNLKVLNPNHRWYISSDLVSFLDLFEATDIVAYTVIPKEPDDDRTHNDIRPGSKVVLVSNYAGYKEGTLLDCVEWISFDSGLMRVSKDGVVVGLGCYTGKNGNYKEIIPYKETLDIPVEPFKFKIGDYVVDDDSSSIAKSFRYKVGRLVDDDEIEYYSDNNSYTQSSLNKIGIRLATENEVAAYRASRSLWETKSQKTIMNTRIPQVGDIVKVIRSSISPLGSLHRITQGPGGMNNNIVTAESLDNGNIRMFYIHPHTDPEVEFYKSGNVTVEEVKQEPIVEKDNQPGWLSAFDAFKSKEKVPQKINLSVNEVKIESKFEVKQKRKLNL